MRGVLSYPEISDGGTTDYVLFQAHEYRTNNSYAGQASGFEGGTLGPKVGSSIQLYMPNSTPTMRNSQSWGQAEFIGDLGAAMAGLSAGLTNGIMDTTGFNSESGAQLIEKMKGQFESIKNKGGSIAKQVAVGAIAKELNMSPNRAMGLARGQVYNPNIELLYEMPTRRHFGFNFILIPKNASETATINKIIMEFKKWSSPSKGDGGMFNVPCVWVVKYMSNGGMHKYMNQFKRAVLSAVDVTANQSSDMHATFVDGMPISHSLGLSFEEVDIIMREDHEKSTSFQGY